MGEALTSDFASVHTDARVGPDHARASGRGPGRTSGHARVLSRPGGLPDRPRRGDADGRLHSLRVATQVGGRLVVLRPNRFYRGARERRFGLIQVTLGGSQRWGSGRCPHGTVRLRVQCGAPGSRPRRPSRSTESARDSSTSGPRASSSTSVSTFAGASSATTHAYAGRSGSPSTGPVLVVVPVRRPAHRAHDPARNTPGFRADDMLPIGAPNVALAQQARGRAPSRMAASTSTCSPGHGSASGRRA